MTTIHTTVRIAAPLGRVFDLARSIDVHVLGNVHFSEQAVATAHTAPGGSPLPGVTSGLIGPGESVTWRARHFGIRQHLTSAITAFDPPHYFQDTMLRGAFHSMQHDHFFRALAPTPHGPLTEMRDVFRFSAPLGPLGALAERLVLRRYMTALLDERNRVIVETAESATAWQRFLPSA